MYYCRNVISRLSWGKKKKHLVKGQEELVESGGEDGEGEAKFSYERKKGRPAKDFSKSKWAAAGLEEVTFETSEGPQTLYHCKRHDAMVTQANLSNHYKLHINRKYSCTQCPKMFLTMRDLVNHNDAKHKAVRVPCEKCGKLLTPGNSSYAHAKRFHSQ